MQQRKRRVWSAVRKDAEAVRTGARRGALVARRGVKKGASDSYLNALARVRIEDPARAAFIGCRHTTHDNNTGTSCFLAMHDGQSASGGLLCRAIDRRR